MNIIIDAMGGDNAPGEIVKGAVLASQQSKSRLVLVGNRTKIESVLREQGADPRVFDIVHAEQEITM
ncbi:MAG: phosphate acyltransferase, partial [Clostridia bacterium]|nr:phosphate acyltransferase [Clostridia bacterium]